MTSIDFARFTGIPWRRRGAGPEGCDCYGLVRYVASEALGLDLPIAPERWFAADQPMLVAAERGEGPWRRVPRGRLGDVVVVDGGRMLHCGLVVGLRRMLHVPIDGESVVESYASRAVIGEYRWRP